MVNILNNSSSTVITEPQVSTPLLSAGPKPVQSDKGIVVILSIPHVRITDAHEVVAANVEFRAGQLSGKRFMACLFLSDVVGHPGKLINMSLLKHLLVGKSWEID